MTDVDSARQYSDSVFLPIHRSEALEIDFPNYASVHEYPCAVKIAVGPVNVITTQLDTDSLQAGPDDEVQQPNPQNYVVSDCWLDITGFNTIGLEARQFVPSNHVDNVINVDSALRITVYPMRRELMSGKFPPPYIEGRFGDDPLFIDYARVREQNLSEIYSRYSRRMCLSPGGRVSAEVILDPYGIDVWDQQAGQTCFVHALSPDAYEALTGQPPPTRPPTRIKYANAGLPWFDSYSNDSIHS